MDVTGKSWVRHYFWPIFCLKVIHKISDVWSWKGPLNIISSNPSGQAGTPYSRMPRVMSKWLLNTSKRDTLHPSWASHASAWSLSQEKSVSWCSKSGVMRPLLCPSSTLYFCHRLPAWDDSGAFSVFLVWLFVFTFHLCCHSVLQETALLQKIGTFDLTWRCSFPGVVLPCFCTSGLDHVLHTHCGGKTLWHSLQ